MDNMADMAVPADDPKILKLGVSGKLMQR